MGSALSFFSAKAFRFYLPAYLIADLEGHLGHADVVFHLYHGLDDSSRKGLVNPLRYSGYTWWDYTWEKFSSFTAKQAAAIVAFLNYKAQSHDLAKTEIEQALRNYWNNRAEP